MHREDDGGGGDGGIAASTELIFRFGFFCLGRWASNNRVRFLSRVTSKWMSPAKVGSFIFHGILLFNQELFRFSSKRSRTEKSIVPFAFRTRNIHQQPSVVRNEG